MELAEDRQKDTDLVWNLNSINHNEKAIEFVRQFENTLCIYSSALEQLYTNYKILMPKENENQMMIQPNPDCYHDTFHELSKDAIQSTGLHIIPGSLIGKKGLYLIISHQHKKIRSAPIPFQEGMRQVLRRSSPNNPFLPILMKGDLGELNAKLPSLHLHRLQLSKLDHLSQLDRNSIQSVISDKLMTLYQEASALNL